MEKICHANTNQKKTGVTQKVRKITRDEETHDDNGSTYQQDIRILNAYVPNNRASKYMKQK